MIDYNKIISTWTLGEVDNFDIENCMKEAIKQAIPIILQEFKDKVDLDYHYTGDLNINGDEIEVYFMENSINSIVEDLIKNLDK